MEAGTLPKNIELSSKKASIPAKALITAKKVLGGYYSRKLVNVILFSPICCTDGWRLVLAGGTFCSKSEKIFSPH